MHCIYPRMSARLRNGRLHRQTVARITRGAVVPNNRLPLAWLALVATLFAVIGAEIAPARAAEALALKTLGFSPDGRYFGFVQYGGQGDGSSYLAELSIIDANDDRLIKGTPVRVVAEMRETSPNEEEEIAEVVIKAEQRAAALIKRLGLSKPGEVLDRVAEARIGETHTGSGGPSLGVDAVSVKHSSLGELSLKLETKEIDWPKTSKLGRHKEATTCASEVDWQKGAGFRLTLTHNGRPIVLNDDKTIPASRQCAMGYGISEVRAFARPDGRVTIAVILGMHVRGFEGEDRVFLAVTRIVGN